MRLLKLQLWSGLLSFLCLVMLLAIVINTNRIDSMALDRWTGGDMLRWADELRKANPELIVPKAEHKD